MLIRVLLFDNNHCQLFTVGLKSPLVQKSNQNYVFENVKKTEIVEPRAKPRAIKAGTSCCWSSATDWNQTSCADLSLQSCSALTCDINDDCWLIW